MYIPKHPVIYSLVDDGGFGRSRYDLWPSNGFYVRTPDGKKRFTIERKHATRPPRLVYRFQTDKGEFHGLVRDRFLVQRITEYVARYLGRRWTNCSAFAYYLTTGRFIECSDENNGVVLDHGMRVFDGQKARVGDMVCIIYARDRICRSRRFSWRTQYLRSKKKRYQDGRFTHALEPKQETMTAEEIRKLCGSIVTDDYHFMVCAGYQNGEPVWVSQRGRCFPGESVIQPVFTFGYQDCYDDDVPLLTLIKRRR